MAILRLAEILKDAFREADILARLGGDEFVVLVPDVTRNYEEAISARLQEKLGSHNTRCPSVYELSLSSGIVRVDVDNTTATVN